ncbi:MAG: hypothetical protein FWD64_01650 [Acidobacteriaceae bacterium]|nr:hypothetical protein [Acidobacteriaceae bacterium]
MHSRFVTVLASMVLVFAGSYGSAETDSASVTVDYGAKHQVIRGFGGATAFLKLSPRQANALFSQQQGLGLSIIRAHVDPKGSPTNGWVTQKWYMERNNVLLAKDANPSITVFASPYTPPPVMKAGSAKQPFYDGNPPCNPRELCGGYLRPEHYKDYAIFLENFVKFMAMGGAKLDAISIANEPDWSGPKVKYESVSWTPDQLHTWLAKYGSMLTAKIIMPESYNFDFSLSNPSLDDPKTRDMIGIVGEHLYGVKGRMPYYSKPVEMGKDLWMTEHYIKREGKPQEQFIEDGLAAAQEIHNSLVTGQFNAYVWWWSLDWTYGKNQTTVNFGLLDPHDNPTFYGYALGQYARFIRPGFYRYEATENPGKNVYVSAYSGSEAGAARHVIVVINAGSTPVTQTFTIKNADIVSMRPWQTTAQGGLAQMPAVAVAKGAFSYTLPPESITTFVQ